MKRIVTFTLFLLLISGLYARDIKPRVAVLPFQSLNTSVTDSQVLTQLFEASLVNTGMFQVLEQNRINEIMESQARSLSGCYDESCAIEVGELLSAEQIVLGSLSRVGGRFILTAKIIDVALGTNISADKVSADSLEEMIDAVDVLAGSLAGLGSFTIVRQTGGSIDIFIETEPRGAEVVVNGVSVGTSPVVAEGLAAGNLVIEASLDNLYAISEFSLSADSPQTEYYLVLEEARGNLLIKTGDPELEVYIDQVFVGQVGNGYLKGITAGPHDLEIKSDGLYYRESIQIGKNSTITITPDLLEVGTVEYSIYAETELVLESSEDIVKLSGIGSIENMPAIEYSASVNHPDYVPWDFEFKLERGQVRFLEPVLQHTEDWEKAHFMSVYDDLSETIELDSEDSVDIGLIEALEVLIADIDSSVYGFPELLADSNILLLKSTEKNLEMDLDIRVKKREKHHTFGWIGSVSGGVIAGAGFWAMLLADSLYTKYRNETVTSEAVSLRDSIDLLDTLSVPVMGAGGAILAAGLLSFIIAPSITGTEQDLENVRIRLNESEAGK